MNPGVLGVKTLLLAPMHLLLVLNVFKPTVVFLIVLRLAVVKLATKSKVVDGVKILKPVPLLMLDLVHLFILAQTLLL